ncbi:MAG: polysaccharide pyruvyl transferase family protein [Actinomycetota bacterium]
MTPTTDGPRIALFGAPGSNTNLGLDALMQGAMAAVHELAPAARFTVFDNQLGRRSAKVYTPTGPLRYELVGARLSRRVTRPESYAAMTASLTVGGFCNHGARAVRRADLVLDVSGGDSFSDIYGTHRFRTVCAPKRLALRARRPLVLLPQTYGPFGDPAAARVARELVLGARQAWARDPDSLAVLADLLGDRFDPARHRLGVDLALLLPPAPSSGLRPDLDAALAAAPVGVNVSGLLWNRPAAFRLRADYRSAMVEVVTRLVKTGREVVLVPHVLGRQRGGEADNIAADELLDLLGAPIRGAVTALPWFEDAGQAKAAISRCDVFVGTRMHSTIAALSSGVPCCAVAYSDKYRGVFAGLGVADAVLDARALGTTDLVDAVLAAVAQSSAMRARLEAAVPVARERAASQMADILAVAAKGVSSARR